MPGLEGGARKPEILELRDNEGLNFRPVHVKQGRCYLSTGQFGGLNEVIYMKMTPSCEVLSIC